MKFICEKCGAKYTIADTRIQNKILKIRCKRCGHIIEVRDPEYAGRTAKTVAKPAMEPAEKPRSALERRFASSYRAEKSDDQGKGTPGLFESVKQSAEVLEKNEEDVVSWFVAMKGSPVGPISARKVGDLRREGHIEDSSLVWKESMPDWAALRDCKDLVGLLARVELNGDLRETAGAPDPQKPRLGLFAEDARPQESPLKGQSVGVIAKRVGDLFEAPAPAGPRAQEEAQEQLESSFFQQTPYAPVHGSVADEMRMSAVGRLSLPRPVTQRRMITLASVGFLFVAIVVFLVQLLSPETEIVTEYVEKVVYRDRVVEVPSADAKRGGADEEEGAGETADGEAARSSRGASGSRGRSRSSGSKDRMDDKTRRLMDQLGAAGPGGGGPKGRVSRSTGGRAAESDGLSEGQLKEVVTRNRGRLKVCYERALKQGEAPSDRDLRVDFRLEVGSSGTVKNIVLSGSVLQYPSLRKCLENSVKRWVFPASSDGSPVEFPFVFTPR